MQWVTYWYIFAFHLIEAICLRFGCAMSNTFEIETLPVKEFTQFVNKLEWYEYVSFCMFTVYWFFYIHLVTPKPRPRPAPPLSLSLLQNSFSYVMFFSPISFIVKYSNRFDETKTILFSVYLLLYRFFFLSWKCSFENVIFRMVLLIMLSQCNFDDFFHAI